MNRVVCSALVIGILSLAVGLSGVAQARVSRSPVASASPATHRLPKGSPSTVVFSFGVQGGSLRPWSVTFALGGSIEGFGVTPGMQKLANPSDTLKGLLTLADAEGFFSLSKQIGCSVAGGPDVSAQTIKVTTSSGSRKVSVYGSCKASFNQLYAVLKQVAGLES